VTDTDVDIRISMSMNAQLHALSFILMKTNVL